MNDHDAIDAINEVLERYNDGDLQGLAFATLAHIAQITGENKIEHEESRPNRRVTSLEDLKTVYEGAVLVDANGDVWSIDGATGRLFSISDGNGDTYEDEDLPLPATVVYEGDFK